MPAEAAASGRSDAANPLAHSTLPSEVTTMNLRRVAATAGILAILAVAFQQARSADPPAEPSATSKISGDFAVRYAQANLRLAELKLQKAQDMNRRVPRTLANNVIEQFSLEVALAKDQLK